MTLLASSPRPRANSFDVFLQPPKFRSGPSLSSKYIPEHVTQDEGPLSPMDKKKWYLRASVPVLILVSSSIPLLVVAIVFVTWMWFTIPDDPSWRRLMLSDYSSMAITLTGVAVRFSVAVLSWVTVAMMTSVLVEEHGVPRHKMAQASLSRFTGAILPLFMGGRWALRGPMAVLLPLQLVIAVGSQFTSTLLFADVGDGQVRTFGLGRDVRFDFRPATQEEKALYPSDGGDHKYLIGYTTPVSGWNADLREPTYETHAELAEPENKVQADDRVDDTGPAWRAYLPLPDAEDREKLDYYRGPARVIDARATCVRPNITELSLVRIGLTNRDDVVSTGGRGIRNSVNPPYYFGKGTIPANLVPDRWDPAFDTYDIEFECSVQSTADWDLYNQGVFPEGTPAPDFSTRFWHFCSWGVHNGTHNPRPIPFFDPLHHNFSMWASLGPDEPFVWPAEDLDLNDSTNLNPDTLGYPFYYKRVRGGNSFMVMETAHPDRWMFPVNATDESGPMNMPLPILSQTSEGPWTNLTSRIKASDTLSLATDDVSLRRDIDISLEMTYCFERIPLQAPVSVLDLEITGALDRVREEPRVRWNGSYAGSINDPIFRQLGVSGEDLTPGERGVLSITPESFAAAVDEAVKTLDFTAVGDSGDYARHVYGRPSGLTDTVFCHTCEDALILTSMWEGFYTEVLEAALARTGSPAAAVQAVVTMRAKTAYMAYAASYDEAVPAVVARSETRRVPVRTAGYAASVGMVVVQGVLIAVAALLFAKRTHQSLVSNAWQAVAHVAAAPDAAEPLERAAAANMSDAEVEAFLAGRPAWRPPGGDVETSYVGQAQTTGTAARRAASQERFILRGRSFVLLGSSWRPSMMSPGTDYA